MNKLNKIMINNYIEREIEACSSNLQKKSALKLSLSTMLSDGYASRITNETRVKIKNFIGEQDWDKHKEKFYPYNEICFNVGETYTLFVLQNNPDETGVVLKLHVDKEWRDKK